MYDELKNKIIFLTELAENKSICEIIPYIDKFFSENQCLNIINDYFYKEVKKTIYLSKNNQARLVMLYREKPDENYESGMYINTDIYLTGFEDKNGYWTEYSTSNQYYLYSNNIFNDENKIINNVELIFKEKDIDIDENIQEL